MIPPSPLRVILLDDEPDHLQMMQIGLYSSDRGIETVTTTSPDEALRLTRGGGFECVVSDYLMPGIDGLQFCAKLRGEGIDIPFILFTGQGSEEVAEKAFGVGVDDYLRKENTIAVYTVLAKNIRGLVERHRAQEALKVSEERLRFALSHSPVTIAYLDKDLRYTWVHNPQLLRPEDVIGKRVGISTSPNKTEEITEKLRRLLSDGKPVDWEAAASTQSEERYFKVHAEPRLDRAGKIIGAALISIDISERRRVEEALREGEKKYRGLFENIQELVTLYEVVRNDGGEIIERRLIECNPAFLRAAGVASVDDIRAKTWGEIFPQDDGSKNLIEIRKAMSTGNPVTFESSRLDTEQSYITTISPLGRDVYLATGRDITDIKKAEKELKWRASFPGLNPFPVMETDLAGKPTYINDSAKLLLNWKTLENISELGPEWEEALRKMQGGMTSLEVDAGSGGKRFALNMYRVLGGDRVRIYAVDVTERSKMEFALRESEKRFRSTLDNMIEGCQIIGRDWRYIYINDTAERHNRRPTSELIGRRYMDMWPGIESTAVFSVIKRCMDERVPQNMENEFTFPDGAKGWFDLRIQPIPDGIFILSIDISQRKLTEEALNRVRIDLDRAQEVGQVGSWRLDIQQNLLTWSDETHRIFGVPKGTPMTYETFLGAIHPEDKQYVDKRWQAAQRGDPYDIEHRIIVGGEEKWVHEKAFLEFDGAGKLLGGFGIVQDITEKKIAEDKLRASYEQLKESEGELAAMNEELRRVNNSLQKSEEELSTSNEELRQSQDELQRYSASLEELVETRTRDLKDSTEVLRSFMDSASEGLSIWDRDLRLLAANDAWMRRWPENIVKESLIGKKMTELYRGIENTERYGKYLKVIETGEPFHYEGQLSGDLVKKRIFSASVFRVGTGLGIISTDVTEEHRLEEELRTSRERLAAFMESATDGFSLYDKNLNLVMVNRVVLSRYPPGTRREDIIGRNIRELYPGVEDTKWYSGYLRLLETGESFHFPAEPGVAHSGKLLLETSAFKVGDGVGVITRDVTHEVELEKKLRDAQRGEAIDKISAMVAHDVRSPLNSAYQALTLAKKQPEMIENFTSMAERNILRAIEMIEDLRENTRLIEPSRRGVNLPALLEDTVREKHLPESVTPLTEYGEGLGAVEVDASLIRRVVENLLSNAVEAMPNGGRIRVTARREESDAVITVTDTGTGIPPEAAQNVFTPLYTTKSKGVGLGLTFCKRVVEAHGGTITYTSLPGQGTTFTVRIPSHI